jgi:hypothetical protein
MRGKSTLSTYQQGLLKTTINNKYTDKNLYNFSKLKDA